MKKYTLLNSDGTEAFGTDFIPTACAFTFLKSSPDETHQIRMPYPNVAQVVSNINHNGVHEFENGQTLIKN